MNSNTDKTRCRLFCILGGVVAALIAWFLLSSVLSTFFLIVLALLVFAGTAYFLYETFCNTAEVSSTAASTGAATAAAASGAVAASSLVGGDDSKSSDAATGKSSEAAEKPSAAKKTTAAKKPAAAKKTSTASKSTAASKKPTAAKKTASKSGTTKTAAAKKPAAAKKTAAKSTSKTAAKKAAGPQLFTSRPSDVDDLKLIAGVGPKLEGVLNDLGVYQYKQVASWKKADIAYVDERLKFKGRIERDDWIKQAKALAKGGEAEYIKVFGKKPR